MKIIFPWRFELDQIWPLRFQDFIMTNLMQKTTWFCLQHTSRKLHSCKNGGGARKGFPSQYLSCGAAMIQFYFIDFFMTNWMEKSVWLNLQHQLKKIQLHGLVKKMLCNNLIYLIFNLLSLQFKLHQVKTVIYALDFGTSNTKCSITLFFTSVEKITLLWAFIFLFTQRK